MANKELKMNLKSDSTWRNRIAPLIVVILLYSLMVFLLYLPLFSQNPRQRKYIGNDFSHYYFPWVNSLLDSTKIKNVTFDHWNFYAASGSPTVIQGTQYYLPTHSMIFLHRLDDRFLDLSKLQLFVLAHIIFAATGFYLLLRSRKLSHRISFFGGLIFIMTGSMADVAWVLPLSVAWTPWIVLLLTKYLATRRWLWLVLTAFFSFQQLAAAQQGFMYSSLFLFLYLWSDGWLKKKNLIPLIFYLLLTIGFSAILLLPILEFNQYVSRQNYFTPEYFKIGLNKLSDLFNLIVQQTDTSKNNRIFIGAISLLLIILSLSRPKLWQLKMILSSALLFIYGLGTTLIASIVSVLPGIGSMRFLWRINEFILIFLIILLCSKLDEFDIVPAWTRKLSLVIIIIALAGFLLAELKLESVLFAILGVGLFNLMVYFYEKGVITKSILLLSVSLLIFFEVSQSFIAQRESHLVSYSKNIFSELTGKDWFLRENISENNYQDSRKPTEPLLEEDYNSFLFTKDYSAGTFSAAAGELSPAVLKHHDRYVVASRSDKTLSKMANIDIENNKSQWPRAYLAYCYNYSPNEEEAFKALVNINFDGSDRVIISDNINAPEIKKINFSEKCQHKISEVNYQNIDDQIEFEEINLSQPAILFISDNYYPGWRAFNNGNETAIIRANYTFKAVELPAGKNKLLMKFKPASVRNGAIVSKLTVIFALVLIIYQEYSRRKAKGGKKS